MKFFILLSLLTVSLQALARAPNCSDLLAPVIPVTASPLTYSVADFEGLYLDIVKDAALVGDIEKQKQSAYLESFLKKKAEFLNLAMNVVQAYRQYVRANRRLPTSISQIYAMISSLGVDPAGYGLQNKDGKIVLLVPESSDAPTPSEPEVTSEAAQPQGFIGFISQKNASDRDLPNHLNRGIGFGEQTIRRHEAPHRQTGLLNFGQSKDGQRVAVIDRASNQKFVASKNILTAEMIETSDKKAFLSFDEKEGEWFVGFENKANPSGAIGFDISRF